jgi:hypothetical protein
MLNLYFYPKIDYRATQSPNPYIFHFEEALERHYHLVNKEYNKNGILDFFKYFFKTDVYILNWIEDLPLYRLGKIQTLFFMFFLFSAHISRKKIVWVLHNKYSHFTKDSFWTKLMFGLLMRYSDLILTHSSSGVDFVKDIKLPLDIIGKILRILCILKKGLVDLGKTVHIILYMNLLHQIIPR